MQKVLKDIFRIFSGDTLIFLLIIFLCLTSLQFACVSSEQHGLQTKALAVLADEGYRSKCLQLIQLVLLTFLVLCQVGIVKFPGAWNVKEPLFYETSQFYESLLLVFLSVLFFVYVLHLLPIYVSVLHSCVSRVWKNLSTTFLSVQSLNQRSIFQLICLCAALFAPFLSECEARNDSAFSSEGERPDAFPEQNNAYLVILAYVLRFFNIWRLPPDIVLFDMSTFVFGLQLALQNILLHIGYTLGSFTGLVLIAKNAKSFPFVRFVLDQLNHYAEDPSDKVVALLNAFAQTQQHLPNILDLWVLSGSVICLWLWIKSTQHKN